jgi:hypothetical protein
MENYLGVDIPGDLKIQEPPRFKKVVFFPYPGKEGAYFSRLLEELHQDKVTVLLVSLPDYIGTYWTNCFHGVFFQAFKSYQQKYDNVRFIDFNHMKKFNLKDPAYFINGGFGKTNSHLSRTGSEVFNRLLIRDCRRFIDKK